MAKLITSSELKKKLKQMNQEDLVSLILELSKVNKFNQEFLTSRLSTECDLISILEDYKNKIHKTFFPKLGSYAVNVKDTKNLLKQFLSISNDKDKSIDIMLFYIETCFELMEFGIEEMSLFNSIIDVFGDIISALNQEDTNILYKKYQKRLDSLYNSSQDINYGLYDELVNLYLQNDWYEWEDEGDQK